MKHVPTKGQAAIYRELTSDLILSKASVVLLEPEDPWSVAGLAYHINQGDKQTRRPPDMHVLTTHTLANVSKKFTAASNMSVCRRKIAVVPLCV